MESQDPITVVELLRSVGLFEDLDDTALERLAKLGTEVEASPPRILVEEDLPARALFIVLSGAVAVLRDFGGVRHGMPNELGIVLFQKIALRMAHAAAPMFCRSPMAPRA